MKKLFKQLILNKKYQELEIILNEIFLFKKYVFDLEELILLIEVKENFNVVIQDFLMFEYYKIKNTQNKQSLSVPEVTFKINSFNNKYAFIIQ